MATADDVARLFLSDIQAPITPSNVAAAKTWLAAENSNPTLRNNPWNLHSGTPPAPGTCSSVAGPLLGQIGTCYVNSSDKNVAVFDTIAHGVQANANNLLNLASSHPEYGYQQVVTAFRAGDATGALTALGNSSWAGSHYERTDPVTKKVIPGTNTLLDNFTGVLTSGVSSAGVGTSTLTSYSPSNWAALISGIADSLKSAATNGLSWNDWAKTLSVGTDPGKTDPGLYASISDALIALKIDPTSKITTSDISKVTAWLTANPRKDTGGQITDAVAGALGNIGDVLMFVGIILVGIVFIGSGAIITLRKST